MAAAAEVLVCEKSQLYDSCDFGDKCDKSSKIDFFFGFFFLRKLQRLTFAMGNKLLKRNTTTRNLVDFQNHP